MRRTMKNTRNVLIREKLRIQKTLTPINMDDLDSHISSTRQVGYCGSSISLNERRSFEKGETPECMTGSGRRGAMISGKNYFEDPIEVTSVRSLDIDEKGNQSDSEYKQSSIEIGMQMIPGFETLKEQHKKKSLRRHHTLSEISTKPGPSSAVLFHNDDNRRRGLSFLKLMHKKPRSRETVSDLQEALILLRPSNFLDSYLASFKDVNWQDLIPHNDASNNDTSHISSTENLRREAVWDTFKCELNFLHENLMVLKHCYMEPLKKLQVDGHLMFVDHEEVFGNLDELCYVSYTFCRDFIKSLTGEMTPEEFGQTSVLVKIFMKWNQHSRNGDVFHSYYLNYENAMSHLERLRRMDQFIQFEKWCNKDERLQRLQLTDLLIAPMQYCTKMPLLLSHIRKYTSSSKEQILLTQTLDKTENYLRSLDEKIMWLRNFDRLQEIQSHLIWPTIFDMEPRVFIPDFLKHLFSRQPCDRLIANPRRELLNEGHIFIHDGNKIIDMYMFLFDDLLIITKIKKLPKKYTPNPADQQSTSDCECFCGQRSMSDSDSQLRCPLEGASFQVYKQPLALDRFSLHDVGASEAIANGIKNAFILIHISRFQQIVGVYTIQATSEISKAIWMDELSQSQQNFQEKLKEKLQHHDPQGRLEDKLHKVLSSPHQESTNTMPESFELPRSCPTTLPIGRRSDKLSKTTAPSSIDRDYRYLTCQRMGVEQGHHQAPKDLSFLMSETPFSPPLSPMLHQDFPILPCAEIENKIERMFSSIDHADYRRRSYGQHASSYIEKYHSSEATYRSIDIAADPKITRHPAIERSTTLSRQFSESTESKITVKEFGHF